MITANVTNYLPVWQLDWRKYPRLHV